MATPPAPPAPALGDLVGRWSGTYEVWLRPGELHSSSPSSAEGTSVLGGSGAFVRLSYSWTSEGAPQSGEYLLAVPGGALQAAFVDTFHTGEEILFHRAVEGDPSSCLTSYGPPSEPWGWRTQVLLPSPDRLEVRAWNITPDATEGLATEALYDRSS